MALYEDDLLQYLEEQHQQRQKEHEEAHEILKTAEAILAEAKKSKMLKGD